MMDGGTHPTLFGWPSSAPQGARDEGFRVIGVSADHGNGVSRGAARGPASVRRAACLLPAPRGRGVDGGDLPACHAADLETVLTALAAATRAALDDGLRPLIIGGDHSITAAPVSVLQQQRDIGVVWFDAHTDFSPWSEGHVHSHKQVLRRVEAFPGVKRLVQIGYRGLTAGDERQLGEKATVVTSEAARGLTSQALLDLMPAGLDWYVSIDIDVIDPFHAPGTSAPVPDGMAPSTVCDFLEAIVGARNVAGADVVEVNPRLDVHDITSAIAARFLWTIADGL
jgi:agmatinase